jgi:hypothetical protein
MALCRALGLGEPGTTIPADAATYFACLLAGKKAGFGDVVPGGRGSPCTDYLTFADWLEEFDIDDSAVNKPFQTRRGYRGVSCRHVEKGDKVCISWGGELPFI